MRFLTNTLLIAASVAITLAAGQPVLALTADEKRENYRLSKARGVSLDRRSVHVRLTYAENCEAAFVAGEPMPERDLRITEEVEIDDDLIDMTIDEISVQFGIASDAYYAADRAVKDCIRKFRKRNDGS